MCSNPDAQPGEHVVCCDAAMHIANTKQRLASAANFVNDLWLSLDEIEAVARSIDLVAEHVEEGPAKADRILALVRAVCELVGVAKGIHERIEMDLKAV